MLLLDTSFLVEFEDELVRTTRFGFRVARSAPRNAGRHQHHCARAIREGILDPVAPNEFLIPFRVVQLSRMIARRTALLQTSLPRRLGENDAWIAGTALAYDATLVGREQAFARVPRLNYLTF